jgi:lipopolysaccharide exporter
VIYPKSNSDIMARNNNTSDEVTVDRHSAASRDSRSEVAESRPDKNGQSLRTKSIKSVMALTAGTVVGRGLRLARYMILVRLLAEELFGVMSIVLAATIAFESFSEVGVQQSVIQNKNGADPEYLNIAWWFQAVRGLGLFVIGLVVAPLIGSFYDNPDITVLLRVAFISTLFRGFVSPRAYALEKQYRFGLLMFIVQGSSVLGTITTIVLVFIMKNIWALIIGYVAETAVMCLLSHILVPFKPTFKINRPYLAELMRFARGMFGLPFLTVVTWQTDVFMLGKLVPEGLLGMYAMVLRLAEQPAWAFSQIFGRVLLPVFAEGQDSKELLRRRVRKVIRTSLIFSVPLVAIVALGAKPIISLIYTPKYTAVAIPFAILCVTMFIKTQAHILVTVCLAVGKPHLHRRYAIFLATCVICLMYPGITLFGVTGAAGVLLFSNIIAIFLQIFWVGRIVDLRFRDYAFWLRRDPEYEAAIRTPDDAGV